MAMGHSLWRAILEWMSIRLPPIFDVHQGYRVLSHSHLRFLRGQIAGDGSKPWYPIPLPPDSLWTKQKEVTQKPEVLWILIPTWTW